jgi:site-specific recombinase XerD
MSSIIELTNNENENPMVIVADGENEHQLQPVQPNIETKAAEYMAHAKAKNTLAAYRKDWDNFCRFCNLAGVSPLPAQVSTVVAYLTTQAENHKVSTLERRIASISQAHQAAGFSTPTSDMQVRVLMQGIRRTIRTAQTAKNPILINDIKAMINTLPDNLLGIRDRALLLVGFAGGFRRSEIVNINIEDTSFSREGLTIIIRNSKTDQEGSGRKVGIAYGSNCNTCPVRSLQAWIEQSGITSGPLFRSVNRHGHLREGRLSDKSVALIIKRTAEAAGLDSSKYSGHSLRAGLATSAAAAGVSERAIMKQTGHRSQAMVRKYIREGSLFLDNASCSLGL